MLVLLAAVVALAQVTPSPTAYWPLLGNSSAGTCDCISDHPTKPGPCDMNEDPFSTYALAGSDTMRYVMAPNTNVSHIHIIIPDCANASTVTAVDCAGNPMPVVAGENQFSSRCSLEDFPTLTVNDTTVKITPIKETCSGDEVFFTVTMPGAVAGGGNGVCIAAVKSGTECSDCAIPNIGFGCPVPTPQPSHAPTGEPSPEPSPQPSNTPVTQSPTGEPSPEPSPAPTFVCTQNCTALDGFDIANNECQQHGTGACVENVCDGTLLICASDADCQCGCTQAHTLEVKRQTQYYAVSCESAPPTPAPTGI